MDRLSREFFNRPATQVAPELLGCLLWHDGPAGLVAVRLVEVEAYEGVADPASHAFRGQTPRNAVMFGPPGHAYVYFTYGMHFCVNLVCQPAGRAEAVLLRAGEVTDGAALAALRRGGWTADVAADLAAADAVRGAAQNAAAEAVPGVAQNAAADANGRRKIRPVDLARGPGRLCQALGIDRALNGDDVCGPDSLLGIGPAEVPVSASQICSGPRVGISTATDRPWRYWLADDRHVSVFRPSKPRGERAKPVSGSASKDGTMHR